MILDDLDLDDLDLDDLDLDDLDDFLIWLLPFGMWKIFPFGFLYFFCSFGSV